MHSIQQLWFPRTVNLFLALKKINKKKVKLFKKKLFSILAIVILT